MATGFFSFFEERSAVAISGFISSSKTNKILGRDGGEEIIFGDFQFEPFFEEINETGRNRFSVDLRLSFKSNKWKH